MPNVIVINGSPRKSKGNTAFVTQPFINGLQEAGAKVDLYYVNELNIKPCECGVMYCWTKNPGHCVYKDDMTMLYEKFTETHILIFATPVYIPFPGKMQNFLNRICPILNPKLHIQDGRTRAILRDNIPITKFGVIATGGWWELGNLDSVIRIINEIAKDADIEFIPPICRPHAFMMKSKGVLTDDGKDIYELLENAGKELIITGTIQSELINKIARPLTTFEEFLETQSA